MKLETICVQGAYKPKNGEPRVFPIVQSTTYKYDSSQEMGDLFDLKATGYFYSRLQNPTCDNAAAKIALLEGGADSEGLSLAMALLCLVLPAVLSVLFCEAERRLGWIKEGDLKLD